MTHKEAPATEKRQKLARLSPDELNELWQALFGSDALKLIETDKILGPALEQIRSESLARFERHGDIGRWWRQIAALTPETQSPRDLRAECPSAEVTHLGHTEEVLRALTAWKKGPFRFTQGPAELRLDAEWHSDQKYKRVQAVASFEGERVLDVGTGNGYFLLRLAGDGARLALGLDPSVLYVAQFLAIQRLFSCPSIALLPLTGEALCAYAPVFDTVMSMGVLYHRRSPLDHLTELRSMLRPGGRLILETLVIPGGLGQTLMPEDRYAQMRNVFFLPSPDTLVSWLRRVGFVDVTLGDLSVTTSREQHPTSFTAQPSLEDFLSPTTGDPNCPSRLTVEGHPRPRRLLLTARAPASIGR